MSVDFVNNFADGIVYLVMLGVVVFVAKAIYDYFKK